MQLEQSFTDIALDELLPTAQRLKDDGWRAMQVLCTNTDAGVDVTYSFSKDEKVENYQVRGVKKTDEVPSLQGMFLGMFPFENEAKDLFGVNVKDMVLDFAGEFYQTSMDEPMTILTPEAKARKDKAAKAAAKAAEKAAEKAAQPSTDAAAESAPIKNGTWWPKPQEAPAATQQQAAPKAQVMTDDEIEAKVAGLPPEKAEKLRAALKAKQAAAQQEGSDA